MAGDWIKMRTDLPEDPAVYRLSRITGLDRLSVVGRLYCFWTWADRHAVDGRVDGAVSTDLDDVVDFDGFADAMAQVKWLEIGEDYLAIPKHDRHNGESAKERSLKNARQARWRGGKDGPVDDSASTPPPTPPSTREEKRREEKINTEPSGSVSRATRKCPSSFVVTAEMREWAATECMGVDVDRETERLRDHTFKASRTDWPGVWRNWMRTAFDHVPKRSASSGSAYQQHQQQRVSEFAPALAKRSGSTPTTIEEVPYVPAIASR